MTRQHISRSYYATDAQLTYLRRLLNECFAKRAEHGTRLDPRNLASVRRAEASAAIDACKRALAAAESRRADAILTAPTTEPAERLVQSRLYFDGDGVQHCVDAAEFSQWYRVGETSVHDVAAPGCGRRVYRITRVDSFGAYGVLVSDTTRELTASDVY